MVMRSSGPITMTPWGSAARTPSSSAARRRASSSACLSGVMSLISMSWPRRPTGRLSTCTTLPLGRVRWKLCGVPGSRPIDAATVASTSESISSPRAAMVRATASRVVPGCSVPGGRPFSAS